MNHIEYLAIILDQLGVGRQNVPTHYLCIDLETTGLQFDFLEKWQNNLDVSRPTGDLILQYSLLEVDGASIVSQQCRFLDWSKVLGPRAKEIIEPKITRLKKIMEEKDSTYPITMEMLSEGVDPIEGLSEMKSKISSWVSNGGWLAGINICQFDIPALRSSLAEWTKVYFDIPLGRIFDPGCIMKGWQARIFPQPQDKHLGHFLCRVASERCPGIFWGIDYLVNKFELKPLLKYASQSIHSADTDCLITYWVIEKLRQELDTHVARLSRNQGSRPPLHLS